MTQPQFLKMVAFTLTTVDVGLALLVIGVRLASMQERAWSPNDSSRVRQWMTGVWLAVLVLVACNRVVPANMTNTPISKLATTRLPTAAPTPLVLKPTPAPATPMPPTSTPPPSDTPKPLPGSSTATSPANEATPTGLEPGAMNEPFEVNFVQAQPNPYWKTYTPENDRPGGVNAFLIDETGRKWIGGYNGLSVFDGRTWRFYTSANGLPRDSIIQDSVTALARDPAGYTWIGYDGGGLSRFDGQTWRHYTLALDMVGNSVRHLAVDRTGRLWFSAGFDLGLFDGQTWTLYHSEATRAGVPSPPLEPPPDAPLIQAQVIEIGPDHPAYYGVNGLAIDPAGPIWLVNRQGPAMFDGQQWRRYSLESNYLYNSPVMVDAKTGQIWDAASAGGVGVFDGQNLSRYNQFNGLPRDTVDTIVSDPAGRKWFGTNAGASVFDGQAWLTYTEADGLPPGGIKASALDPAGHVWLVTSTGALAEFTPPSSPAALPTPVREVSPRLLDFTIASTTALTAGDVISVTWQAVGEQAELCLLSGRPVYCRPAPVSGSQVITVDDVLLTEAISGVWLNVTAAGHSTRIFGELKFQCRYAWFFDSPSVGCPEAPPIYSRGAAQYFERGLMIWSEQPDRFYVFFDENHQLAWFDAAWVKEVSFLATPEPLPTPTGVAPTPAPWPTAPPPGAVEPISGFGRVWRHFWRFDEHGLPVTVRQDIGWATGSEFAFETAAQCALGTAAYGGGRCFVRNPAGAVLSYGPISTLRDRWNWQETPVK